MANLELMAKFIAGEVTQVKESILWVRCASGNVLHLCLYLHLSICDLVRLCICEKILSPDRGFVFVIFVRVFVFFLYLYICLCVFVYLCICVFVYCEPSKKR